MRVDPAVAGLSVDQLRSALDRIGRANDMLPPREDDKVAGRIAPRFVEGLRARIEAGAYRCSRSSFVPVSKRALTTRPAAVTTLRDRVVFEALVELTRNKINKYLQSSDVVMWPRADDSTPAWQRFEQAPLEKGGGFVISADVAGYYASIDHGRLAVTLADAGVAANTRNAIIHHLGEMMDDDRGLPQGIETSDVLATAHLAPVDDLLQRTNITFWRHGDDYRLWTPAYPDALSAVYSLEQALRVSGLLLNEKKLKIESYGTYGRALDDVQRASRRFQVRMEEARKRALLEATEEDLAEAIDAAGIDEDMQWRFWYHRTIDIKEMIEALAPSLTPKSIEVVIEMFKDLMTPRPREVLPAHLKHARLTFCIRRLARAKSQGALPWVGELLIKRPDETQDLANYMLALISVAPKEIVAACQYALTNKAHLLDWERAWIYRVLSRLARLVHKSILMEAKRVAESDASNWLARVEATRLLARAGILAQETAMQVAHHSPECYKGDIAGIIAMIEEPGTWAAKYLDGARRDPLEAVVIDGVRTKMRQERLKQVAAGGDRRRFK